MANLSFDYECVDYQMPLVSTPEDAPIYLSLPLIILFAFPASFIILCTVFGNLLVLCFKAKVGRTNTTLLVWNLGLTDFLVGILVLPLAAMHLIFRKWMFSRTICRIWVAADVTFCTCSVVTICIISVDRYLAVTRPLHYKSVVTKAKVIVVMITIWTFSSMILLTTVRWDQPDCVDHSICFAGNEIRYLAHSVVFAFFLPAAVTLTLYWRIYRLARNRQRALDRGFLMVLGHNMNFLTNTLTSQQSTTMRVHFGKNNGMVEHQRRVLRTHERIAKTLGVVSCSFLFCWLPFFLLYLTNFVCKGCIPTIAIDISSWLGYCNSMINPIIYAFTVKEFKRSALRMVLPIWRTAYRILPKYVGTPPEHVTSRMSRTGNRAKGRQKQYDRRLSLTRKTKLPPTGSHRRRMTEPAVFTLNNVEKEISKQQPIIEENEVEEDDSATHHFTTTDLDLRPVPTTHSDTTFCPANPNRRSSGYSSRGSFRSDRRLSSCLQNGYRKVSANGVRKTSELKAPLAIANGTPATVACNGNAQKDACSVTVYCVTNEMNV